MFLVGLFVDLTRYGLSVEGIGPVVIIGNSVDGAPMTTAGLHALTCV